MIKRLVSSVKNMFNKDVEHQQDNKLIALSTELKQMYLDVEACGTVLDSWDVKHSTMESLINMFMENARFSIEKNVPPLDYLIEHFKGHCERYGLWVNDDNVYSKNKQYVMFAGESSGKIYIDDQSIPLYRIYVRHDSHVDIVVNCMTLVFISLCGGGTSCHVKVEHPAGAAVVYRRSKYYGSLGKSKNIKLGQRYNQMEAIVHGSDF